jgi:regulator of protease activity HflC (stomatin/prohibitin superfamily)
MKNDITIVFTAAVVVVFIIGACMFLISAIKKLPKIYHAFIVPEGYVGLLYQHGKFVEQLAPGRHVRWGRNFTVDGLDTRKAFLPVAGQEVLTADNINVKLSLVVAHQIADAVKAVRETQSWQTDLYNIAQLALRSVVSGVTAEALLTQRLDIAPQLLARVQPDAAKMGITVHTVQVKDVMLPAELKRAYGDVLKAKQEGQSALERARGESAALRNLANAARVLEGNPSLMNLRVLQSLATAQNAGNTLVLGMPAGFVPLKNGNASSPAPNTEEPS